MSLLPQNFWPSSQGPRFLTSFMYTCTLTTKIEQKHLVLEQERCHHLWSLFDIPHTTKLTKYVFSCQFLSIEVDNLLQLVEELCQRLKYQSMRHTNQLFWCYRGCEKHVRWDEPGDKLCKSMAGDDIIFSESWIYSKCIC